MKKLRKKWCGIVIFVLLAIMWMLPVQAKTLQAKKYALKNVAQAECVTGEWVDVNAKIRFLLEDGTYVKSRWINVDNVIYYMNRKGNLTTGWIAYRGHLYYMNEDGSLHLGWLTKGKKTYYFGVNGAMVTGLKTIDGEKYYFNKETGVRMTGWVTIKKNKYYFSKTTGQMKKSAWIKQKKKYYYVNASGKKLKSRWLTIGEDRYYLDETGARVTGKYYIDNKGYYFGKDGVYDPSVKVKPEVDPSKPMVALTYDDGPGKYTDRLLDCLKKNNAKATFFMVGSSVPNYKSTVKRMATMGCELGNHSYSHPAFTTLSTAAMRSQVTKTAQAIKDASGKSPTVFRLPYGDGAFSSTVLGTLGLPSIYWSVDTRDWANTGNPQHTINAVLNSVKDGDIILMHDIHYSSVVASETIIPALIKRGYQLVTVSQLAKYKGKTTLKNGVTYRGF